MKQRPMVDNKYCCDHGIWHGVHPVDSRYEFNECNCTTHYGSATRMRQWLSDKGYHIDYSQDITEPMRTAYVTANPTVVSTKKNKDLDPVVRKLQRAEWTKDKIKTLSSEELIRFKDEATSRLMSATAKHFAGKGFLKEFTMVLIRMKYECPY